MKLGKTKLRALLERPAAKKWLITLSRYAALGFVIKGTITGVIVLAAANQAQKMMKDSIPPMPKAVEINKPGTAKWTPTTFEAASGEEHKKVLAAASPKTVTGEVVDVSCYLQLGKRGEAHIPCGSKCIAHGEPIGLVDAQGTLYLLFAEEHHPRRDGMVDVRKVFAPLLAKQVEVTGMASDMKGVKGLFVQAAEFGGKPVPIEEPKPPLIEGTKPPAEEKKP